MAFVTRQEVSREYHLRYGSTKEPSRTTLRRLSRALSEPKTETKNQNLKIENLK